MNTSTVSQTDQLLPVVERTEIVGHHFEETLARIKLKRIEVAAAKARYSTSHQLAPRIPGTLPGSR